MRATSVISGLTLLAAAASAAPLVQSRAAQASGQPLQVTNLVIDTVENGNTTIKFNVYDPDPLTNSTGTCTGSWKQGTTDYPKDTYDLCGNTTFAWNMDSFDSIKKFTLGLEHQFTDPAVGDPPWDQVTNFAHATVNTTYISCNGVGDVTCQQKVNSKINAPVYATTAKR